MFGNLDIEFVKELFDTYRQMMFKTAFGILHNESDSEDAVQNAFLWIINNLEKFSQIPCNEMGFYIANMVEHISINIIEKKKRHPIEDINEHYDLSADDSTEDNALSNLTVEEIKSALKELSDRDYGLLYLYLFKEMTPKEIGETMDIPESNIRVYIHRARKRFIKILKKRGFDYEV